ncbi:MAG: glycine cleavage system protein H, partial [Microbacterium sp. 13-71-7]
GTVLEINDAVVDDPSLVNSAPFEGGWLIKISVAAGAVDGLLDRDAYVAHTEG